MKQELLRRDLAGVAHLCMPSITHPAQEGSGAGDAMYLFQENSNRKTALWQHTVDRSPCQHVLPGVSSGGLG